MPRAINDRRSRRKAVSPSKRIVHSNTGNITAPEFGVDPTRDAKIPRKAPPYHRVAGKRRPRK